MSTFTIDPDRLHAAIDSALAERRLVGGVLTVTQHGEDIVRRPFGLADREAVTPVAADTLFRYASVTKPVVALTALRLIAANVLALDEPITTWLPDFTPPAPDGGPAPTILIRHLLTHTSGLSYRFAEPFGGPYDTADISDGMDLPGRTFEDNLARIASVPLAFLPGTSWRYSVALDVLGAAIERATGGTLGEAVAAQVTGTLGLTDTGFTVVDPARLATPYVDDTPEPHLLREGETVPLWPDTAGVTFAPSRAFDTTSFPSGGAGAVGSAGDIHAILDALRADATDGAGRLLDQATAAAAFQSQIGAAENGPGTTFSFVGSVIRDRELAVTSLPVGSLTWGGVYGNWWFVDPTDGVTVTLLTNTLYEGMSGQVTIDVRDAIYGPAPVAAE